MEAIKCYFKVNLDLFNLIYINLDFLKILTSISWYNETVTLKRHHFVLALGGNNKTYKVCFISFISGRPLNLQAVDVLSYSISVSNR